LDAVEDCTPEQIEARRNLVASLVMGVAKLTNQQVETATSIAMQETMLNWAGQKEAALSGGAVHVLSLPEAAMSAHVRAALNVAKGARLFTAVTPVGVAVTAGAQAALACAESEKCRQAVA
jgi:hypothetical protein